MVIHEANLVDYARMNIAGPRMDNRLLRVALAPWQNGDKVRGHTPFVTPWRTIQIADRAADLSPSVLGLNLNPRTSFGRELDQADEIHWHLVGDAHRRHSARPIRDFEDSLRYMSWHSGPRHGATTANTKTLHRLRRGEWHRRRARRGMEHRVGRRLIKNANAFSFTRAYPDYNLPEVARYAQSKGVKLIVHNETSGGIVNYERQLDSAFALYHSLGLDAIKSGYVTDTTPEGNSHHSQFMVRHYRRSSRPLRNITS